MTPLEVKKINHHQGRDIQRSSVEVESAVHGHSRPGPDRLFSKKVDDDEPTSSEYASGKDELKAIYLAKTGESFPVADLDAIEATLVGVGITWDAFVADIRGHAWDRITSPIGFLKNRAKKFRALTRATSRPVTAAEAAIKNYRCPLCSSTVPGEGARRIDGKTVPCSCASPEYVARQRARGVFAEDSE
jgi:hypothetical protein